ncbi:pilus assembly protein [Lysobacter arenosi]|uniref:Pilus assembly protein n=1 Tax=Lysobacter arenosi TaxID=2795387 RepID=A0ABX7RCW7_9GAMM|nr:PilX N-terminal domain-containing pilus assembly protein [Lysobacter arenosi]QSX75156.1 pilus assembly protein [Lysobacter arenosi]
MRHSFPTRQKGVALFVVLILLVILTLLGLAAMRGTLLEERMSANLLDRGMAFQATEAALREGEEYAESLAVSSFPASGCADGLCSRPDPAVATDNQRWQADGFWDDDSGFWREATVDVGDLTAKPRFIVELLDTTLPASGQCSTSIDVSPDASCSGNERRYRVTAYSHADGRAEVMLQSTYAVP